MNAAGWIFGAAWAVAFGGWMFSVRQLRATTDAWKRDAEFYGKRT